MEDIWGFFFRQSLAVLLASSETSDMTARRCFSAQRFSVLTICLLSIASLLVPDRAWADKPAVLDKPAPENVDDLKAIQKQVKEVLEKVVPATVGVRIGNSSGSGVIVTKDGYVLTAGHVSGAANRDVTVIFADGKTVKGKTLGGNHGVDSGLIKITDEGEWPVVEMGKSADVKKGDWCLAVGHPGGFVKGRSPPVRLGRILGSTERLIRSDCTLVGGDSGGPLFDLEGKVIGIHSRIGNSISDNVHVPVDAYRDGWDRMVKAEIWGVSSANPNGAYMGVRTDPDAKECLIVEVSKETPAEKAGIRAKDIVTKFDGKKIRNADDLIEAVKQKKPGDEVSVEVRRGDEFMTLKVTLTKRGG
jgi:serine protease Do